MASGANVYGDLQGQEELVIIPNGENFPTGFVVDQTIEKVTLSGALSDYTFSKSGTTDVLVYKGNVLVATIRPQTDDDVGANGTALTFTSGSVLTTTLNVISGTEIRIGGVGGLVLNGTAAVYEPAPADVTAPVFASASVNGTSLVMTYTEATTLDASHAPAITDFTVSGNTVTAVAVDAVAKTVTLTLGSAVLGTDTVTVGYTDPTTDNDTAALQDAAGNDAATVSAQAVTNNTSGMDTIPPTTTIANAAYFEHSRTIYLNGANFDTILDAGEARSTDIKERLDWSKLIWDINGDNATTPNIAFTLADIESAVVPSYTDTQLIITLTPTKHQAILATTDYAGDKNGPTVGSDTVDISAGFIKDSSGNPATSDAASDVPLGTVLDLTLFNTSLATPQSKAGQFSIHAMVDGTRLDAAQSAASQIHVFTLAQGNTLTITNILNASYLNSSYAGGNLIASSSSVTEFRTGSGNDVLTSTATVDVSFNTGAGADQVTLGSGADTVSLAFGDGDAVFSDSFVGAMDTLTNFTAGVDKIDLLTAIDGAFAQPTSLTRFADVSGSSVSTFQELINNVLNSASFLGLAANAAGITVVDSGAYAGTYLYVNDGISGLDSGADIAIAIQNAAKRLGFDSSQERECEDARFPQSHPTILPQISPQDGA